MFINRILLVTVVLPLTIIATLFLLMALLPMSMFIVIMQSIYDLLLQTTGIASIEDSLIFNQNLLAFRAVIRLTYKMVTAMICLTWKGRSNVVRGNTGESCEHCLGGEVKDEDETGK